MEINRLTAVLSDNKITKLIHRQNRTSRLDMRAALCKVVMPSLRGAGWALLNIV